MPTTAQLPKPPGRAQVPGPSPPSSKDVAVSGAPSEEKTALDKLLQAMSADESGLSPQLRELLEQHRQQDTRAEAKNMHRMVAQKAAAKKELNKLRATRGHYIHAWAAYLDQVASALQQQIKEHGEVMADYALKESQWEQSLQEATATLAKMASEDVETVSDEEDSERAMEIADAKADEAALAAVQAQQAAEKIQGKNDALVDALQQAKQQAEEACKQEQARERTPRRGKAGGADSKEPVPGKAS